MSRNLHEIERAAEARVIAVLSWPMAAWFFARSVADLVRVIRRDAKAAR